MNEPDMWPIFFLVVCKARLKKPSKNANFRSSFFLFQNEAKICGAAAQNLKRLHFQRESIVNYNLRLFCSLQNMPSFSSHSFFRSTATKPFSSQSIAFRIIVVFVCSNNTITVLISNNLKQTKIETGQEVHHARLRLFVAFLLGLFLAFVELLGK